MSVRRLIKAATKEFTRPANTTAYAAKDVVGTDPAANLVFTDFLAVAGESSANMHGSLYIVKARLATDQAANTARFRAWLYHTAPTAIVDNDPYTSLYADFGKLLGYIDLPALTQEGTGSTAAHGQVDAVQLGCAIPSGKTDLVVVMETLDGFTPASGQKFSLTLTGEMPA